MQNDDAQSLAFGLLAASRALIDGVSAGVKARGFAGVRPAHGFAFTLLSAGGATITQLAEHLDVTRQAAAQLVDELSANGYVERRPHPRDARARLIVLTEKGWACTHAAEAAIKDTLRRCRTLDHCRQNASRLMLTASTPRSSAAECTSARRSTALPPGSSGAESAIRAKSGQEPGNTQLLALVDASAHGTADMVGNLGRQSGVVTRAGTDDLRGDGDLPTRAHAQ